MHFSDEKEYFKSQYLIRYAVQGHGSSALVHVLCLMQEDIVGVGGRGQQPGMNRRSCNYSGGPGSPRPELNNMTQF
jgi:hypothetical protein